MYKDKFSEEDVKLMFYALSEGCDDANVYEDLEGEDLISMFIEVFNLQSIEETKEFLNEYRRI